jgi:transposase
MWLLRRLAPDFKTIADFRRENGPGIVGTCRAFVLFCREQGLFATRLVALDGSKFRAAASAKRIMGERDIAEEAARIDQRIAGYLADLDATDATETDDADAERTASALVELKARRAELAALAAMLEAEHRTTLVEGEPDARSMGMGAGRKPPSYNVQAAVDVETSLIVHHEVTTEPTDNRLLFRWQEQRRSSGSRYAHGGGGCGLLQWGGRGRMRARWHHALRAGEQGREQSRRLLRSHRL